jgi:PST family polysaccharide transporter
MPTPDNKKMDVYSAVRWSAVSKYGAQGVHVVVSLVLARLLAPEYFGLLGMATVITGFVKVFKNLGFNTAIVQRKTTGPDLLSTLFWVNLAVCLVVAGVVAGIAPLAASMYQDPRVAPIVAVLAVNFVMAGFTMIPTALLTRQMAFHKLAVREIAGIAVDGTTSIALALCGWGVWALVAGTLAGHAAQMVLINLVCPFRPRLAFDKQGLKECLGFGLNLTGFNIFNYFARHADNLIIGIFLGPVALGYYALAYKLMLLPRDSVTNVVARVLLPAFSRMQDDDERLAKAYLRTCGAIAFVTFPMMAGLAVVARPFVEVVLGEKWLPAVPLIWILAVFGALQAVTVVRGHLFLAKGRADLHFAWGVIISFLSVCGFFAGLPWGVRGVALAYVITSLTITVPAHRSAFKLVKGLRLRDLGRALAPQASATLAMSALVSTFARWLEAYGAHSLSILAICVPVGVITYTVIVVCSCSAGFADLLNLLPTPVLARLQRMRAERVR